MTDTKKISSTLQESMSYNLIKNKDTREIVSLYIECAVFTYLRARKCSSCLNAYRFNK